MSTREILHTLKEQGRILPELKFDTESLGVIFSIAGSVLNTKSLVDGGIAPTLSDLLLPHLITTFAPSLLANGLYTRFKLGKKDVVLYVIGFLFSIFAHSSKFLMFFIQEIPYVSGFFSTVKLKNSKENTFDLFSWTITSQFAGMAISKLILKKKLKVKPEELLSMIAKYGGVLLLRRYNMNDYWVIVVANMVPLTTKAIECLAKEVPKLKQKKKEIELSQENSTKRTPRRKASISVKLEKKGE